MAFPLPGPLGGGLIFARMFRTFLLALVVAALQTAQAQSVLPYVDHWDSLKTVKRSEGLFVNGREWGEWKFYDRQGKPTEVAEFKSGERDGHVVTYYDNGEVKQDGYIHKGSPDSTVKTFYRTGTPMEQGAYAKGVKEGPWSYWYADGKPMLNEIWDKGVCLTTEAWDRDGSPTVVKCQ